MRSIRRSCPVLKYYISIFINFSLRKEEVIPNPVYVLVKLYEHQISSKEFKTF